MYAIVETGGMQFKVQEGDKIKIPKLEAQVGDKVSFDKILLIGEIEKPLIGNPFLKGAKVLGEVLKLAKGEKVTVYKFKKRTKYRRKTGHRQDYCEVKINQIVTT
jgi:large subunit ribosomal protein L21